MKKERTEIEKLLPQVRILIDYTFDLSTFSNYITLFGIVTHFLHSVF